MEKICRFLSCRQGGLRRLLMIPPKNVFLSLDTCGGGEYLLYCTYGELPFLKR